MAGNIESASKSSILFILMFVGLIAFMIVEFVRTPFTNLFMLLPALLSWVFFFVVGFGQFIPIIVNPNFQTDSGVNGTYFDGPFSYHGGKVGYKVALFKWNVPEGSKRANKGISGLFSFLAAVVVIEVVDFENKFRWIVGPDSEATREKGCLRYEGRLDGKELKDIHMIYREQLQWFRHTLGKIKTIMAKHKAVGERESQEYNQSMLDASEKIAVIIKDYNVSTPNVPAATKEQIERERRAI